MIGLSTTPVKSPVTKRSLTNRVLLTITSNESLNEPSKKITYTLSGYPGFNKQSVSLSYSKEMLLCTLCFCATQEFQTVDMMHRRPIIFMQLPIIIRHILVQVVNRLPLHSELPPQFY